MTRIESRLPGICFLKNKSQNHFFLSVTPKPSSPLFTPILSGLGKDYTGISFPYDSYFKFQGSAPVLAGQCIDVKVGSKINLSAAFYNPVGSYEYEQEIQMPNRSSSCRTNPQDGVVINQLQMHRIASSCVRGRAAFRGAANENFRVSLFATPQGDQVLWQWNRPLASAKTVSDGRFCVDHIPANRTFTFYFIQENPDISIEFPVKPLMAEECEGNARGARIEIKVPASQGFQCATDYDRCTDLGDIQGELQSTCGPG